MPGYAVFVGVAALIAVGVVGLTRLSQPTVSPQEPIEEEAGLPVVREESLPTGALLLNVLLVQGVLTAALVGAAELLAIPWTSLGLGRDAVSVGAVVAGLGYGVGLYVLDEALTVVARWRGAVTDEAFRESLTPASFGGWLTLFVGVLPVVAVAEELLFRAALIGVSTAGVGVPAWVAVGGSSLVFGTAHGAQGRGGVVVTTVLGIGLGGVFLVSGSLVTVAVAHYVVNGLEFLVHETRTGDWWG